MSLDIGVSDSTQTNTGLVSVEISTPAVQVIAADPGISVVQIAPTIKLSVNVSNKLGATLRARFSVLPVFPNSTMLRPKNGRNEDS